MRNRQGTSRDAWAAAGSLIRPSRAPAADPYLRLFSNHETPPYSLLLNALSTTSQVKALTSCPSREKAARWICPSSHECLPPKAIYTCMNRCPVAMCGFPRGECGGPNAALNPPPQAACRQGRSSGPVPSLRRTRHRASVGVQPSRRQQSRTGPILRAQSQGGPGSSLPCCGRSAIGRELPSSSLKEVWQHTGREQIAHRARRVLNLCKQWRCVWLSRAWRSKAANSMPELS